MGDSWYIYPHIFVAPFRSCLKVSKHKAIVLTDHNAVILWGEGLCLENNISNPGLPANTKFKEYQEINLHFTTSPVEGRAGVEKVAAHWKFQRASNKTKTEGLKRMWRGIHLLTLVLLRNPIRRIAGGSASITFLGMYHTSNGLIPSIL